LGILLHLSAGAATAGDGRVIFAPLTADVVDIFDPRDDALATVSTGALTRVIFAPHAADVVDIFDPSVDASP
jgi:hypothetical protein